MMKRQAHLILEVLRRDEPDRSKRAMIISDIGDAFGQAGLEASKRWWWIAVGEDRARHGDDK